MFFGVSAKWLNSIELLARPEVMVRKVVTYPNISLKGTLAFTTCAPAR